MNLLLKEKLKEKNLKFLPPRSIEEAEHKIINLGASLQEHAYLIGKYLQWVKERMPHGQFVVWIIRKFWFTDRTGRKMMEYAEECDYSGKLLPRIYSEKVKKTEDSSVLGKVPLPEGTFNVIYADPPWQYSNSGFDESAENTYKNTMSDEEIFEMIEDLNPHVAKEAVLFLWVTAPFLNVGLQVCEAWSFQYKQNMVWVKNKGPSMGWFVQSRHEHLFIATRGEGMHPEVRPVSYFEYPTSKHSAKPHEIYDLIEKMYPNCNYLELFARNTRKNWKSWGNEL